MKIADVTKMCCIVDSIFEVQINQKAAVLNTMPVERQERQVGK